MDSTELLNEGYLEFFPTVPIIDLLLRILVILTCVFIFKFF